MEYGFWTGFAVGVVALFVIGFIARLIIGPPETEEEEG